MTYISTNYATLVARPESFITKGKKRLKQHTNTVYLNNGDEFEIELFNPTKNKLLAKIEINGNPIGSGIVLRPGERVFLERYLDEAKKFLFETYVISGKNKDVQEAIANNGDVQIKFHEEIIPFSNIGSGTLYGSGNTLTINNPNWNINNTTPFTYTTHNTLGGTSIPTSGTYTTGGTFTTTSTNTFYNSSLTSGISNISHDSAACMDSFQPTSVFRSIETGRVEKGSNSNQSFSYDNSSFRSYASYINSWKIKPQSTKLVVKEDLVTYCTECGAKRKKDTHKFCPHCGTKF